MSQKWFVRIGDKVVGPHPSAKLRKGAESGKLLPTTLVREGEEGPWIEASRIPGLFSNRPSNNVSLPEPAQADGWYYLVLGETFGPFATEQLIELSEKGTLNPDTDIKYVENGEDNGWVAAESLPALSELFSTPPIINVSSAAVVAQDLIREDTADDPDNYSFNSVYETGQSVVADDQPRPTALRRPSTDARKSRSRFAGASSSLASDFFDFRWMVTPKLVRGLFMLLTILVLLAVPVQIIWGYFIYEMPWWAKILYPFGVIIAAVLNLLLFRVIFEAVMLPFMVHDALEDIRDAS